MTNGSLIQGTACSKLAVQSAVHFTAEAWRLLALNTVKNYFAKCGFPDHVSDNDDKAMKLTEDKENDWCSQQLLVMQTEGITTCDSTLKQGLWSPHR